MLPLDTSFGRPRIPLPGLPIPARQRRKRVMYAGSNSGQMYALTRERTDLWNFASGGSVIRRPSIVDGTLYWGSGYRNIHLDRKQQSLCFTLAGEKNGARTRTTTPAVRVSSTDDVESFLAATM